ncbi:MAG: hypothetical protein A2V81_01440 [Candidatus Abawacabacteria bacterium RBG_16_42_10]|uniref:Uncharacterized protein n=1 Tax=Candidatus Abawacabacteria bacterium RBG_16_42_10 TaxID=1817814 RepID=A0A1F4XLT5_9BACT|nr:MAG: hypothetical protein A2V81_01440 [Candidatus Abawacabacteria bacterium RBG_16_42_10]
MRQPPLHSHGHRGHRERIGQILKQTHQKQATFLIVSTGKSIITGAFVVPEEEQSDIILQITKLMAYGGTFDDLDI